MREQGRREGKGCSTFDLLENQSQTPAKSSCSLCRESTPPSNQPGNTRKLHGVWEGCLFSLWEVDRRRREGGREGRGEEASQNEDVGLRWM